MHAGQKASKLASRSVASVSILYRRIKKDISLFKEETREWRDKERIHPSDFIWYALDRPRPDPRRSSAFNDGWWSPTLFLLPQASISSLVAARCCSLLVPGRCLVCTYVQCCVVCSYVCMYKKYEVRVPVSLPLPLHLPLPIYTYYLIPIPTATSKYVYVYVYVYEYEYVHGAS